MCRICISDLEVASRDGAGGPKPYSLINGLGEAIAARFSRWNLTEAEAGHYVLVTD